MMPALEVLIEALEKAGCKPVRGGARCPAHDDKVASLTYKQGTKGATVFCHAGCTAKQIVESIGLTLRDLFDNRSPNGERGHGSEQHSTTAIGAKGEVLVADGPGKPVAEYVYQDELGKPLIKVVRFEPKTFRQARWDGNDWHWGLGGARRVLYNLPAVIKAVAAGERVWIVEGERDVETLRQLGLPGTCNLGGAGHGKWRADYGSPLAGARVAIIPDDDPVGLAHAEEIRRALGNISAEARVVSLGGPKDVSDWAAIPGHTREVLEALLEAKKPILAPTWIELMTMSLPPIEPIVDPIITVGTIGQVHAWRGIGKSIFLMQLAFSVASGRDFLKWPVPKPFRVMLVDGEMPAQELQQRLEMIRCATEPGHEYDPPGENFRVLSAMLQDRGIPSLAMKEGQEWFEPYLEQADVFLFDHLSALFRGGEENAAESWAATQEWLLKLRSMGKTSLFAHHDSKMREQRGTSAREDILSISIHLKELEDDDTDGTRFRVRFDKARSVSGEAVSPFEARLAMLPGTSMRRQWTLSSSDDDILNEIEEMMRAKKTVRQIAHELKLSRMTVQRKIEKIREQGLLEAEVEEEK
jgi:hypothetical protein